MEILNFIKYATAGRVDLKQIIESRNSINCIYYYYSLTFKKTLFFSFFGHKTPIYSKIYIVNCLYCESVLINGIPKKSHYCKDEDARIDFELLNKIDLEYLIYIEEALKGIKAERIIK